MRGHTPPLSPPQLKDVPVTDEMLASVGAMQLVETVALLSGGPDNGFRRAATAPGSRHQLTPRPAM